MHLRLADHGTVFATRARATRMLADLPADPSSIDFAGVRSLSYSFADEFVGKLLQRAHDHGEALAELVNLDEPDVREPVEFSLTNRGLTPQGVEVSA